MSNLLTMLQQAVPITFSNTHVTQEGRVGLIVIDAVNGFLKAGAGNLAPPVLTDAHVKMINIVVTLVSKFDEARKPMLLERDCHPPGKGEPPYVTHCEEGSGEEELIDELQHLKHNALATILKKDCVNAIVGAMLDDGRNDIVEWVNRHQLTKVVVVGICTDICVMDFVLTLLSLRNQGKMPTLVQIAVVADGCVTYDLPAEVATELSMPRSAIHPQDITHYMGLYMMSSRGAVITRFDMIVFEE